MKTISTNISIQQLVALMKAYAIRHVVVCPGSRNAPIVHTIANSDFSVHAITDERSAGFVAIGIADATNEPVAVCCTSGTAVLNLAPAVAEAAYRNLPLLVISADRPERWINQMDAQTMNQRDCFGEHTTTYNLSEKNDDRWYRNRIINQALTNLQRGPVHINVPLDEPLFGFAETNLPEERKIATDECYDFQLSDEAKREYLQAERPMIIIGQSANNYKAFDINNRAVIVAEPIANFHQKNKISRIEEILETDMPEAMKPDFVTYVGGRIVSKRLKQFLRKNPPKVTWHVTHNDNYADLFQCLTRRIIAKDNDFLQAISSLQHTENQDFCNFWRKRNDETRYNTNNVWDEKNVVVTTLESLPQDWSVVLGNSSAVRLAELVDIHTDTNTYCNRGVNGIEGTLSQAIGVAMAEKGRKNVLCILGDLSFFYDMNALTINDLPANLSILLINNGGGKIFEKLPGLEKSEHQKTLVAGGNSRKAQGFVSDCNCSYFSAKTFDEFKENLPKLFKPSEKAKFLETFFGKKFSS